MTCMKPSRAPQSRRNAPREEKRLGSARRGAASGRRRRRRRPGLNTAAGCKSSNPGDNQIRVYYGLPISR